MSEILGIGNAICDILVKVENSFFNKIPYEKESMSLISIDEANQLLDLIAKHEYKYTISSGGSLANTISLLSKLGVETSFIGNVDTEFYGKKFTKDLTSSGVDFINLHNSEDISSARCIVLVAEDGSRTMCTYLGCSSYLRFDNSTIKANVPTNVKYAYVEGYILDNPATKREIFKVFTSQTSASYVLSLSDKDCVHRNRAVITEIINFYANTLIGNDDEFAALLNVPNLNKDNIELARGLLDQYKNLEHLVITLNKDGAYYINNSDITYVPTESITPYDSTGAGDAFAAGYLYGLVRNIEPEKACKIGHLLAGNVIQHLGARPDIQIPVINDQIRQIA